MKRPRLIGAAIPMLVAAICATACQATTRSEGDLSMTFSVHACRFAASDCQVIVPGREVLKSSCFHVAGYLATRARLAVQNTRRPRNELVFSLPDGSVLTLTGRLTGTLHKGVEHGTWSLSTVHKSCALSGTKRGPYQARWMAAGRTLIRSDFQLTAFP